MNCKPGDVVKFTVSGEGTVVGWRLDDDGGIAAYEVVVKGWPFEGTAVVWVPATWVSLEHA
jgi:hypothetical protein